MQLRRRVEVQQLAITLSDVRPLRRVRAVDLYYINHAIEVRRGPSRGRSRVSAQRWHEAAQVREHRA